MPAAIAIPLIVAAASSGATVYAANRQAGGQQDALNLAREQGGQQSALSRTLADYSRDQYALSRPALSRAIGLYSRLAGGDRSTVQSTIAPEVASINQNYEGSQRYLDQQGVRGGTRDMAVADLNRQRTGQVGMLPMQARMGAAGALASLGSSGTGQALSGLSAATAGANGAGATYLGLAGQERTRGDQVADFGSNIAGTVLPWLLQRYGGANRPASTGLSSLAGPMSGQRGSPLLAGNYTMPYSRPQTNPYQGLPGYGTGLS